MQTQKATRSSRPHTQSSSMSAAHCLQEHDFEVVAAAFSHDSRLLATIGNEQ